ncbi:hypothetical protein TNCT_476511 [Trichonephila clavata]|uniref:Uncharacterized protein n=1 Tax=Trichonephila clavata TaxID=2740835 RepID=A0A8X6GPA6_TRICU|nr:hypothetical protein TNCT_476511 [Trichonephila clavata]
MKLASPPVDRIAWHPSYPCPGLHHVHVAAPFPPNGFNFPLLAFNKRDSPFHYTSLGIWVRCSSNSFLFIHVVGPVQSGSSKIACSE